MPVLRVRRPERCQRLARRPLRHARLQDVQHLVGRPGLRRRRQGEHVVAVIGSSVAGVDPLARVGGKVVERHRAAERASTWRRWRGDLALVEAVAALLLQQAERLGEIRDCGRSGPRPAACPFSTTSRSNRDRPACSIARIAWRGRETLRQRPVVRDALGDGETLLRVVDGRLQRLLEGDACRTDAALRPSPTRCRVPSRQDAARRHSRPGAPVSGSHE